MAHVDGIIQNKLRWNFTLQWRHNGHDCVSDHQPYDCLLNRLFRHISKKTSKLRATGLCAGNSPGPVNSPHKWPVTRKMFPFDDVIMKQKYRAFPPWHYLFKYRLSSTGQYAQGKWVHPGIKTTITLNIPNVSLWHYQFDCQRIPLSVCHIWARIGWMLAQFRAVMACLQGKC